MPTVPGKGANPSDSATARLCSTNSLHRKDALRQLLHAAMAERGVSTTRLAEATSHTRQRTQRLMAYGEVPFLHLSDAPVLPDGLAQFVVEQLAGALGFRLVPESAATSAPADVLAAASSLMVEAAEVLQKTAASLDGGITEGEARALQKDTNDVRRALNVLDAAIAAAVVVPLASRR